MKKSAEITQLKCSNNSMISQLESLSVSNEARLTQFNLGVTQGLDDSPLQEQKILVRCEVSSRNYLLIYHKNDTSQARRLHESLRERFDSEWRLLEVIDWEAIVDTGAGLVKNRISNLYSVSFILICATPALFHEWSKLDYKQYAKHAANAVKFVFLHLKDYGENCLRQFPLYDDEKSICCGTKAWSKLRGSTKDSWADEVVTNLKENVFVNLRPIDKAKKGCRFPVTSFGNFNQECGNYSRRQYVDPHVVTPHQQKGQKALSFLLNWLKDPEGEVFCAIFGELGAGKTTLTQRLTKDLLDKRSEDTTLPFPIYLDLRGVNHTGHDWNQGVPDLDSILGPILRSNYNIPLGVELPSLDDVKRLAQEEKGLIIFDGLDEVMNRLKPDHCLAFINQLWNVLPPTVWKDTEKKGTRETNHGRLIMTCRSHFFKTLEDQLSALSGNDRDTVRQSNYLWVTLLPFDDSQIEDYFKQVFGPEKMRQNITTLDQFHDLRDLASRPYNLKLIQEQIEPLKETQRNGYRVNISNLYEGLVNKWMVRDNPKHQFTTDHKLLLMEKLAHHFWENSKEEEGEGLASGKLEEWLSNLLDKKERWRRVDYKAYLEHPQSIQILHEDLRNATFITRSGAHDTFRFAHTSIQEFFLAKFLHRALVEDRPEDWAIALPSPETLDFLGELIAMRNTEKCLIALTNLRSVYRKNASELTLAYSLRAYDRSYPGARFDGFNLPGAILKHSCFESKQNSTPMNWDGANFSGAQLEGSRFINVNLTNACLDRADLTCCLFDKSKLNGTTAKKAILSGAIFYQISTDDKVDFSGSSLHHTKWLNNSIEPPCSRSDANYPKVFFSGNNPPPQSARPVTITGHAGWILSIAFNSTGNILASASHDRTIRLWDTRSWQCLLILRGHAGDVTSIAFNPANENILASASDDKTVRLWDTHSGKCIHNFSTQFVDASIAFDPSGRFLAIASSNPSSIRLWNTQSCEFCRTLTGHTGGVTSVAFNNSGKILASASKDKTIRLWDPHSGECCRVLKGHTGDVTSVAFNHSGETLASASKDNSVRLWDIHSGNCLRALIGNTVAVFTGEDSDILAFVADNKTIKLWNIRSGEYLPILNRDDLKAASIALNSSGDILASTASNAILLWNTRSGEYLRTLMGGRHSHVVMSAIFSPSGNTLVSAHDKVIMLWNIHSRQCSRILKGHKGDVTSVAFNHSGKILASASKDKTIRLWDPHSGECCRILTEHTKNVTSVTFNHSGETLASASDDKTIRLWNVRSGECSHTLRGHTERITSVAFNCSGESLASASDDETIRLWNTQSGECLHTLKGHTGRITSVAFNNSGKTLASASDDKTIRLWDICSNRCLRTLREHTGSITSVGFDYSGKILASASNDKTIRLWHTQSWGHVTLSGHTGWVCSVAFSPSGNFIASASSDSRILLWPIKLDSNGHLRYEDPTIAFECLPGNNWVSWEGPLDTDSRWICASEYAWVYLGWDAPTSDNGRTLYPMQSFKSALTT